MIRIQHLNEASSKIICDEGIAYELSEHFCFTVPGAAFSPKFRSKLWDGKIRMFNRNTKVLPRGLVSDAISYFDLNDYDYIDPESMSTDPEMTIVKAREFFKKLNLVHEPRDYQETAFLYGVNDRRNLLLSATSSGKSLLIYLLLHYFLMKQEVKKCLVVVPTINLVNQLFTDFEDYSSANKWNVESSVHRIYSGKDKDTKKPITISTWQSICDMPKEYFDQFDMIIGDEAHTFKAKSLSHIMQSLVNAKIRIGTTGTLDNTKIHELVLRGHFGPVRKIVSSSELMAAGHAAELRINAILLKHDIENSKKVKDFSYAEEIEYLIKCEARNKFIVNLAVSLTKGNTLVLYQYVDKHGKILYDAIKEKVEPGRKVFFIHGGKDSDDRETVRSIVETESNAIIVASFGTFSTGVNIRNLHYAIFASPSKARIKILQSIGRILRKSSTLSYAVLYDIADDCRYKKHENYTLKHFAIRIELYAKEKFNFKIFNVNLKESKLEQ